MTLSWSADRVSGLFFLLAGLAMIFGVIPAQVEVGEGGNIAPSTLPYAMSILIAGGGGCLFAASFLSQQTDLDDQDPRDGDGLKPRRDSSGQIIRAGGIVLLLAVGLALMSRFGFITVAPLLALALMWIGGERRWHWLVTGGLMVPAMIWLFVVQVLGRQLI